MKVILEVLNKLYEHENLRKTCIPLFIGNPGLGKTNIISQFAKEKGVNLLPFVASTRLPNEISGIVMPDSKKKRMEIFDYDAFLNLKDGDIIFFDEILNANPMTLNACLTFLENRELISGRKLPNVMIVAAANRQGATILTPQIKERFIFYNVKFDPNLWSKHMYDRYVAIPKEVLDLLCNLIEKEKFHNSTENYNTPRSFTKAIDMIIEDCPTPYYDLLFPIVNTLVENLEKKEIIINSDFTWKTNEKISWIELQKQLLK